jgi:hypothetical protein
LRDASQPTGPPRELPRRHHRGVIVIDELTPEQANEKTRR